MLTSHTGNKGDYNNDMGELVLIYRALQESSYSANHITLLLREGKIKGRKEGRIWLVDLDSLKEYEAEMSEAGTKKFDPTKNKEELEKA